MSRAAFSLCLCAFLHKTWSGAQSGCSIINSLGEKLGRPMEESPQCLEVAA